MLFISTSSLLLYCVDILLIPALLALANIVNVEKSNEKIQFLIPEVDIPRGIPLVVALKGFSDAGNAVAQMGKELSNASQFQLIFVFDNDEFLDYRARRPTITFEVDHLTNYDPQKLELHLTVDQLGAPFLLLSGYEPDFSWQKFITIVQSIIVQLEVSITTWVHAIPMPVPHTRPLGVTVSGNRQDLIESRSIWQPTTKLAASIGHVLEHALYQANDRVVGFVLLVPHYLANTDYPDALKTSLECVMDATGLLFLTEDYKSQRDGYLAQVEEQINANEESRIMVQKLEERYDEYVENMQNKSDVTEESDLPTGDELAETFEKFLAERWSEGDDKQGNSDLEQ